MNNEQKWKTIFDKLAQTAVKAEELSLMEIVDVLSRSYDEIEKAYNENKDDEKAISRCGQFASRMERRIDDIGEWIKRNRVHKDELNRRYVISNYDYSIFVWAIARGFVDEIDNLCIRIPFDSLSGAEKSRFDSQVDKK